MFNTDWLTKKKFDSNSVNHFYKQYTKDLKEIRIVVPL